MIKGHERFGAVPSNYQNIMEILAALFRQRRQQFSIHQQFLAEFWKTVESSKVCDVKWNTSSFSNYAQIDNTMYR